MVGVIVANTRVYKITMRAVILLAFTILGLGSVHAGNPCVEGILACDEPRNSVLSAYGITAEDIDGKTTLQIIMAVKGGDAKKKVCGAYRAWIECMTANLLECTDKEKEEISQDLKDEEVYLSAAGCDQADCLSGMLECDKSRNTGLESYGITPQDILTKTTLDIINGLDTDTAKTDVCGYYTTWIVCMGNLIGCSEKLKEEIASDLNRESLYLQDAGCSGGDTCMEGILACDEPRNAVLTTYGITAEDILTKTTLDIVQAVKGGAAKTAVCGAYTTWIDCMTANLENCDDDVKEKISKDLEGHKGNLSAAGCNQNKCIGGMLACDESRNTGLKPYGITPQDILVKTTLDIINGLDTDTAKTDVCGTYSTWISCMGSLTDCSEKLKEEIASDLNRESSYLEDAGCNGDDPSAAAIFIPSLMSVLVLAMWTLL